MVEFWERKALFQFASRIFASLSRAALAEILLLLNGGELGPIDVEFRSISPEVWCDTRPNNSLPQT